MKKALTIIFFAAITIFIACNRNKVEEIPSDGLPDTILKLNSFIQKNPNNSNLYHLRSKAYMEISKMGEAMADIIKAIALDNKNSDYYVTKGDIYFTTGKVHDAIKTFKQARQASQTNEQCLLKLGEIFYLMEDYKASLLYLDTAAKLNDLNPKPWNMGGFAMIDAGDTINAIRYFNEALKRDNRNYIANVQLGVIYTHLLNPLALEYYQNALDIKPESAEVLYNMGKYYQDKLQYNDAIECYHNLLKLKDGMGFRDNAYFNLGYIHIELKVYDAARDYFGMAINENPQYYQAYYGKGFAHQRLGDMLNARAYYDQAIEINPGYQAAINARDELTRQLNAPF